MSAEEMKDVVRRYLARIDTGDIGVVDEFVAEGYDDHNPPPFQSDARGVAGARDAFAYALKAFSDFRHEIHAQYVDGDHVITRVTGRGRHTGDFMGIPATNKDVSMEGIAIHRVVDGKVVEHWAQIDALGLLMQLGAVPPPAA